MKRKMMCLLMGTVGMMMACGGEPGQAGTDSAGSKTEETVKAPFTEGVINMGMYMKGTDLRPFIEGIDFSRQDTREQFEKLSKENGSGGDLVSQLQAVSGHNPLAGMILAVNTVICDYYIKDQVVMGKACGLGFIYDHLYDMKGNKAGIYMETSTKVAQIPAQDRSLSASYVPSDTSPDNPHASFNADLFDRKKQERTEQILGYDCDVVVYTPKSGGAQPPAELGIPVPGSIIKKLVVYTSPLFSKSINFAHPFYLPEESGVLRVDIFLEDGDEPTLVMRPDKIVPGSVPETAFTLRTSDPIYSMDMTWAMKSLPIFMSGWATFGR